VTTQADWTSPTPAGKPWPEAAAIRTRLGLAATVTDAQIDAAADYAKALLAAYMGRPLALGTYKARFHGAVLPTLLLPVYPVQKLNALAIGGRVQDVADWEVHGLAGLTARKGTLDRFSWNTPELIEVEYDAGYDPIPDDLLMVFYALVNTHLQGGASVGGGGLAAGAIESVTIPDVGTIRYATGASAAAKDTTGGAFAPLADWMVVLERYNPVRDELYA
jgi:hypothetical protein